MATSTMISKTLHARSNSLPSSPHPLISHTEELLRKFNASQTISSSSPVSNKLIQLKDLYDCVDELLRLPESKQALAQGNNGKQVDGLLDGALKHLDICGYAKDALSQNKEHIHELQSSLRRRSSSDEHGNAKEVAMYLSQRRLIKKAMLKAMKNSKVAENISTEIEISSILSILSHVQAATVTALESLLAAISGKNGKSTTTKWSLVSKLMQSKHISSQKEETSSNEFEMVDATLKSLKGHKMCKNLQTMLRDLELTAQDLEGGVECLFRQLLKLRVSLLNFLSH